MTKIKTPEPEDLLQFNNSRLMHPSIVPSYHHQRMAPSAQAASPAVRKPRRPSRALSPSELRARAAEREEMQSLLTKLKQLVPNAPKKRKTSKLEIIQSVIDYIFDLQVALESHPINGAGGAAGPIGPNEFASYYQSQTQQTQSQQSQPALAMAAAAAAASFDPTYHMYHQHHHQQHHSQQPSSQYPLYECPQQQSCDPSSYHHHHHHHQQQYHSQMTTSRIVNNPTRPQERQPLASIML